MGTVLTSYGDAGYDHEGYPAQVLDDGSLTATYSNDTEPRMVGQVVAACDCGWTGTTRYPCPQPFDEHAEALALAEWEHDHARPVLEHTQQRDLERLTQLLRDLHRGVDFTAPTDARHRAGELERALVDLKYATRLAQRLHAQLVERAEIEDRRL